MKSKIYELQHKHIPTLKHDIKMRSIFSVLFFLIFIAQFVVVLFLNKNVKPTNTAIVLATITLTASTASILANLYFISKNIKLINKIEANGKAEEQLYFANLKSNFLKIYGIINEIFSIILIFALLIAGLYSVIDIAYYENVPYYLPAILTFAVLGFSSYYHLNNSVELRKIAEKYYDNY